VGEIFLELEGAADSLQRGIQYLRDVGVDVQPVEGDIVE
jgi:hypothetical protein